MSEEKLPRDIKEQLEATGVSREEIEGADAAQQAAEETIANASGFFVEEVVSKSPLSRENQRESQGMVLVLPYDEEEIRNAEQLLENCGIKFREEIYREYKPHLLSALILASQIGIDANEALQALNKYIQQEAQRLPYLVNNGIPYELGAYFFQEYILRKIASNKNLNSPENFKPTDERREFMRELAGRLDEREKEQLARYVASTNSGFSFSPFYYSLVDVDVSSKEGLRRQNITLAITPQSFPLSQIRDFLRQEGVRKENFLLAMANPHLRTVMPFGALLANNYRVTLQYSSSDKRYVSLREAFQENIKRRYDEEKPIGYEPKGFLPLEELAAFVVIDNLESLPDEDLESKFAQIVPQVLQAHKPLALLEKQFPDIGLFFNVRDMNELLKEIEGLRSAINNPDRVPPEEFWYRAFTELDPIVFSFFTGVRHRLTQLIYQEGGQNHLQKWQELVKSFAVSEDQKREGPPLSLILVDDQRIVVSSEEGPLFALIKRKDGGYGGWYPVSFYDMESRKSIFGVEGKTYEELRQMIATSPFKYQIEGDYFRGVLRESLANFAVNVYNEIKDQVKEEELGKLDLYLSHAATSYRQEDEQDFWANIEYFIGALTPYGVGIYDSIFYAFVRHLWKHGALSETDLSITVPLTGEKVTIRHPLFELNELSFKEIKRRLRSTETDVRIPEVTIRRSSGYELRAKAWVYEAVEKLRELSFDAVLGKTMAEEFNRQAARIYVEHALIDLGFLPKDYQREKPLASLQDRQQQIYSKALDLGFTLPLKSGYLDRSLTLPLTWDREKELWEFLEKEMSEDQLQEFTRMLGIDNLNEYLKTRLLFEMFLNFASGWGWTQYDRSNEFPTKQYRDSGFGVFGTRSTLGPTRSLGEYAVSTQAQDRFKAAKKKWEKFLPELQQCSRSLDDSWQIKINSILALGEDLVFEINRMSGAEVTDLAEKIIRGKIAAVGRDMQNPIEIKTWEDFYEAVKQLMETARLVLIYRSKEGRFGWEVSTDKEETS